MNPVVPSSGPNATLCVPLAWAFWNWMGFFFVWNWRLGQEALRGLLWGSSFAVDVEVVVVVVALKEISLNEPAREERPLLDERAFEEEEEEEDFP